MTPRLLPWTLASLCVLACSGGETPSDQNGGGAGKGPTSAGTGAAGSTSTGGAGKGGTGTGGNAGTGVSGAGMTGSAGTGATGASGGATGASGGTGGSSAGASGGGAGPVGGTGGISAAGTSGGGAPGGGMGGAGNAGAPSGGTGNAGAPSGGMGGSGTSAKNFTCNQVIGIDSTSEWFTSGFENQVPNDKWQIIYHHPGYVENWANDDDEVWGLSPTSACTMNTKNPDRVIFNIYSETLKDKASLVIAINQAIQNFKTAYSNLKRIDILTMTRSPDNMPCQAGQNGAVVAQYVDDAVAEVVAASTGAPQLVASPKFKAMDCSIFKDGGPHFTDAGKPVAAKIYGDYYSTEP